MRHPEPPVVLSHYLASELINRRDDDSLDLGAIFAFISRSWRLWLIWLGLGVCLGIAFLVAAPSYYTASSVLVFYNTTSDGAAGRADVLPTTYVDTQIEVLQSQQILDRVIDQNHLIEGANIGSALAAASPDVRNATIKRVERGLSIRQVGTSDTVTVEFTARDRARAARVANSIVSSYIAWRRDLGQQDSTEAVSEISRRLAEVRAKALSRGSDKAASAASPALLQGNLLDESREIYRATYNNLLRQATTATTPYISPVRVRVLTPAEPPLNRSWPKLIFVFGIAAAGAAIVGFAHSLLRELFNRSPKTVEAVERLTGLDCITGIPRIEPGGWIAGPADANGVQQAYLNASPDFCEALIRLAVRLQHAQRRPFAIGVVATTAGAGTSSVTAHLANILAESGQRALIIDANWKKSLADAEPETASNPSRVLARRLAAIHLEPDHLDVVLLRATTPISPVNAANSISAALQQLAANYDCVVVDFPSTDQTADLEATLDILDKVIVVAEAGRSTPESLIGLMKRLPDEKIEAILVNKISPSTTTLAEEFARFTHPMVCAHQKFAGAARSVLSFISFCLAELKTRSLVVMPTIARLVAIVRNLVSSIRRWLASPVRACRGTASRYLTVIPVAAAIAARCRAPRNRRHARDPPRAA